MHIAFIVTLILGLYSLPLQAAESSGPVISQVQGMVVVNGKNGFSRASKGLELMPGDEVRTGRSGKAYIDFPDNSRVKLGARANFIIQQWKIEDNVFTSTLKILQGAFRYTAGALKLALVERNTTLTTNTAVLGVRGTDFWGRVERDNTFFLLLEGRVEVGHPFSQPQIYDKAGHAIDIHPATISDPTPMNMDEILPLAAETEISAR